MTQEREHGEERLPEVVPIELPRRTYTAPPEPPRERGCGCWIAGVLTLLIAGILVGVGLFLPPVSLYDRIFGPQYALLNADQNAVAAGDFTLAVYGPDYGDEFGVALETVPMQQFINGDSSAGSWIPQAQAAAPANAAVISDLYSVQTTGVAPAEITLSMNVGAGSPDTLDLYGWDEEAGEWRFLPAQVNSGMLVATVSDVPDHIGLFQAQPPSRPRVLVAVDVSQTLTPEVAEVATIVAPGGLQPTLAGSLTGSLAAGFELNADYLVVPVIRNFVDPRATDPETVTAILSNRTLRSEHAAQVASFAGSGYDGVMIDYRDIPEDQRDNFTAFVRELDRNLANTGLLLGVVVPEAENREGEWYTGAYDWRALGQHVDLLQIDLPIDPLAYAPGQDRPVEAMLRWTVGEVSPEKVLLGLSALSTRQAGNTLTSIGYDEALSALGDVIVEADMTDAGTVDPGQLFRARLDGFQPSAGTDEATGQPYLDYLNQSGTTVARMWLATPDALRFRMDRTIPFALSGVAFTDLLAEGVADGVLDMIAVYKMGLPAQPSPRELALRWTIEGVDGVIDEVTTGLEEPLIATITAPDGNYAVNVAVVEMDASGETEAETLRGGAPVSVFAPTLTPTPRPTETPTPQPSPTTTPNRDVAATSVASAQGAPLAPVAGSIVVGNFEYGGHVTGTGTGAAAAMQRAGMTWMKVQIRYSPGMDPGVASGPIGEAHARGFKILLGIVGSPGDLAAGGQGYMQQFASFLGGVAAQSPDAIEVWNEPNLDREWPEGQISGTMYAQMLQLAYNAIKSANSNVMVISGAPAPTGAEAAFPGRVMNDDRWIRELVAAGGAQWMDCLGAHYNEGIVGPSQRSGDPRDNYYTRYFGTMLDTYWNAIGGQRPICFTELGYLTPEGLGPLPSFFSWAQNVTLAQQAAWLAEAAALASQSGRVRLMIIWNVDFSLYGSDPQAGYAIVRPGGGCPACDAMAAAR
ncbi:MAG TPA: hypothetical protein VK003_02510 [Oceanobacillus sp.]|nr:hypothetical protein [Oceanobacillus sp.]